MPSLLRSFICALAAFAVFAAFAIAETPAEASHQIGVASHMGLNDATALLNKNVAASGNSVAITRSNIIVQQSDMVEAAHAEEKPAVAPLPWDLTLTGERDALTAPESDDHKSQPTELSYGSRDRFFCPRFRGGYHGWRYPLGYWNVYGRRVYGRKCPFNRTFGDYYYC